MKEGVFKLFFIFLMSAFSLIWISDKLSVFLENDKYSYSETTEKEAENQTENKLKTLFVCQIDFLNLAQLSLTNSQNITSFYFFNIKEFCFESLTPPPEKT